MNEGFEKYQEYMKHIKCPEEVEAYVHSFNSYPRS